MGEECSWFDTDWKQEDKKQTVYRVNLKFVYTKKKKKHRRKNTKTLIVVVLGWWIIGDFVVVVSENIFQ